MDSGISVIICCYNSASRLPQTIAHLAKQSINSDIKWEIIIVDNASTDDSAGVAAKEWKKYDTCIPFTIHTENRPGLNFARQKGISVSKYSYLLFCDDDNWLNEDYLARGYNILAADAKIGALGGIGIPVFEGTKPEWFDKFQLYYAVGRQSELQGDVSRSKSWIYGAGMMINREAIKNLDKHRFLTTDRKGKSLSSGGDMELCFFILTQDFSIWYDEELIFKHFIEIGRLEMNYLKRMMMAGAKAAYLLDGLRFIAQGAVKPVRIKRNWIVRFVIDNIKVYKVFRSNELPLHFQLKLHFVRISRILKLNFDYDRSFKLYKW
ncbi:glycosyltransferase [Mucilaginibacter agri]|uniref:Glycosyltransferase n=1 Tax=Mucilaginibacter agri TaxID=2695265 RepID=A0A965ZD30_9SPHI|nr:glycosyltransferase [Mucilaginibacter agri]NCD67814.1 glycosyltransferase [Mucilaginibacter agri]